MRSPGSRSALRRPAPSAWPPSRGRLGEAAGGGSEARRADRQRPSRDEAEALPVGGEQRGVGGAEQLERRPARAGPEEPGASAQPQIVRKPLDPPALRTVPGD